MHTRNNANKKIPSSIKKFSTMFGKEYGDFSTHLSTTREGFPLNNDY